MRTLLIISIVLGTVVSLSAQSFPYKIYDTNNEYHQYLGFRLLEFEESLIAIGKLTDTLNNPAETNLHVSSFDINGSMKNLEVWNNPEYDVESMSIANVEHHIYDNKLILTYFSTHRACVVSKDLERQTNFQILSCEQEQGIQKTRALGASVVWPYDSLQIVQNTDHQRSFLISGVGLEGAGDFVDHTIEPDLPYRYLVLDIDALDQDTLIVTGLYLNSVPDSREDHERGVFIAKIDKNYNLVDYALIGKEYTGSSITVQGHLDEDGYMIVGCGVLDKQDYIDTGLTRGYSVMIKVDPSTYEVLWETPLDSTVFTNFRAHVTKFEDSHHSDGYIYVGRGRERPTGGATSLIYGKISKEGEQLWHHEFFDPYAPSSISAFDVLATSDGYYTLTGFRTDSGDGDGFTTLGQLILMKFDEDGNVVEMTTSTEDEQTTSFAVVPNPAQDEVTIQTGISQEKLVYVVDMAGQLVLSETCHTADCTLDISEVDAGSYTVLLSDNKGEMLGRTPLVIKR